MGDARKWIGAKERSSCNEADILPLWFDEDEDDVDDDDVDDCDSRNDCNDYDPPPNAINWNCYSANYGNIVRIRYKNNRNINNKSN